MAGDHNDVATVRASNAVGWIRAETLEQKRRKVDSKDLVTS